jgi:hypothetical protein
LHFFIRVGRNVGETFPADGAKPGRIFVMWTLQEYLREYKIKFTSNDQNNDGGKAVRVVERISTRLKTVTASFLPLLLK